MLRPLLILVLLVMSGTGCSGTRPFLSPVVVTLPGLSFRRLPTEESWRWTAVAVTYPSGATTPAPCGPSPVCSAEPVTLFEDEVPDSQLAPSAPLPVVTALTPAPELITPEALPSAPSPENPSPPSQAAITTESSPIVQASSTTMSPASPVQLDYSPHVDSPENSIGVAYLSPVLNGMPSPSEQPVAATLDEPQHGTAQTVSLLAPVQSELSELIAEVRKQRQLIEKLQRDLARERSLDDAEIEELEAAFEDLLALTMNTESPNPSTMPK
jgi:hypothetical protein